MSLPPPPPPSPQNKQPNKKKLTRHQQHVRVGPLSLGQPVQAPPQRLVEVAAAVERRLDKIQQPPDAGGVLTQFELPHVFGAGEREHVAPALLLARGAHAFEGQGLGDGLARAAHRAGRVDAKEDGPAVGGRPDLPPVVSGHARRELAPPVALVRLQPLLGEAREEKQARLAHAPAARQGRGLGGKQAAEVAAARQAARLLRL